VVDEAIRNVVAVGADPDRVALLDNFSWGDPRRESTLGDLVAAVEGCVAAASAYRAPFVSGKDSLNNEYTGTDGQRHAVPPTLVITAVAHVPDADRCVTPVLRRAGDLVLLLGVTKPEFAGSHLDLVEGTPHAHGVVPAPDPAAPERYRRLHGAIRDGLVQACHDVSDGGLGVALAELCIAGRLGITVSALPHDDVATALFAESQGRLVVEVAPRDLDTFRDAIGADVTVVGTVTEDDVLIVPGVRTLDVTELADAFHRIVVPGATA
jgi:phosphoribosylformylglycinamidine synthase